MARVTPSRLHTHLGWCEFDLVAQEEIVEEGQLRVVFMLDESTVVLHRRHYRYLWMLLRGIPRAAKRLAQGKPLS